MIERRINVVSSSQAMVLDAYYAETFVINLRGSVTSLKVKNVTPGRLYVFIVKMDQAGGHTIRWGAQIINAAGIFKRFDSVSVLCFIGTTGGYLQANAPATWLK